jgi:RimJ/RimL family protein N-acetyltransferase
VTPSGVSLRDITVEDLPLYEAIHCDPRMMEHLGGPLPREGLAEKLEKDAATTAAGETWVLVIVPDEDPDAAAGTVTIWSHEEHGEEINEIGWMVLPAYQGSGMGKAAVQAALDRAGVEKRWGVIHAFPPVDNARSNAMCRTLGFEFLEERDFKFRDRPLRCNVWRLDLRE